MTPIGDMFPCNINVWGIFPPNARRENVSLRISVVIIIRLLLLQLTFIHKYKTNTKKIHITINATTYLVHLNQLVVDVCVLQARTSPSLVYYKLLIKHDNDSANNLMYSYFQQASIHDKQNFRNSAIAACV